MRRFQAVPQITSDFNSLEDVGWYGTAYQLAWYVFCSSLQLRLNTSLTSG